MAFVLPFTTDGFNAVNRQTNEHYLRFRIVLIRVGLEFIQKITRFL